MPRVKVWNPIKTIPRGKPVQVLTVRGLEVTARFVKGQKILFPDSRVDVKRIPGSRICPKSGDRIGDIRAVGWR
jgi:hypothetical protein